MPRLRLCGLLLLSCAWFSLAQPPAWRGTWIATGAGPELSGNWTARLHTDPNVGQGTWTLFGLRGNEIASGTWSARKAASAWEGRWQVLTPSGRTYSGAWTASLQAAPPAQFSELLQSAVREVVGGTWRMSRTQSGAWSIRAYPAQ